MFERYLEFAVSCSRKIDASQEAVWSIISNVKEYDKVLSGVMCVEVLPGSKLERRNSTDERVVATTDCPEGAYCTKNGLLCVGMKYRVHRVWTEGKRYYGDWTVTNLRGPTGKCDNASHDSMKQREHRVVSLPKEYSIAFFASNLAGGITSSTTWSIRPTNEYQCILTIAVAVVPQLWHLIVYRILCPRAVQRRVRTITEKDLEDIAIYAKSAVDGGQS
jgi:hypothetical protein